MPNGNVHNTAGAILGPIAYIFIKDKPTTNEDYDIGELLLSTCISTCTARIPDILEPAINPNHRDFFHSIVFGGLLGYAGYKIWEDLQERRRKRKLLNIDKMELIEIGEIFFLILIGSVLLHLILDAFTPKGLPFI